MIFSSNSTHRIAGSHIPYKICIRPSSIEETTNSRSPPIRNKRRSRSRRCPARLPDVWRDVRPDRVLESSASPWPNPRMPLHRYYREDLFGKLVIRPPTGAFKRRRTKRCRRRSPGGAGSWMRCSQLHGKASLMTLNFHHFPNKSFAPSSTRRNKRIFNNNGPTIDAHFKLCNY